MSRKKKEEKRKEERRKKKWKKRERKRKVTYICDFIDICAPAQKRSNDICVAVLRS